MKIAIATLIVLCFIGTAVGGPKINFNFGVEPYRYYYGPPVPTRPYGYYDRYGNYHRVQPNPYVQRPYMWHYGPSFNFGLRP